MAELSVELMSKSHEFTSSPTQIKVEGLEQLVCSKKFGYHNDIETKRNYLRIKRENGTQPKFIIVSAPYDIYIADSSKGSENYVSDLRRKASQTIKANRGFFPESNAFFISSIKHNPAYGRYDIQISYFQIE